MIENIIQLIQQYPQEMAFWGLFNAFLGFYLSMIINKKSFVWIMQVVLGIMALVSQLPIFDYEPDGWVIYLTVLFLFGSIAEERGWHEFVTPDNISSILNALIKK